MKTGFYASVGLIVWMLFLAGCGPGPDDLALTVESQVSAAVMATQAAWPTPTSQSTFTPYPTYTPAATFTPYPTLTPYPTQTPLPTYTPLPTETAVPPTETPTVTATAVPTTISANPPLPTAVSNPATERDILAASLALALEHIDSYVFEISPHVQRFSTDNNVNCTFLLSAYEGTINSLPSGFSTNDEWLQAIYNSFSLEIEKFATLNQPWADGCRESLAAGQEIKETSSMQSSTYVPPISEILSVINGLHDELRQTN
ncbi:MAG: hypothetical protein IPM76_20170 [Chloroflexi bacterium]|nr:hypothetical protein [Chloroflexota bacterium]